MKVFLMVVMLLPMCVFCAENAKEVVLKKDSLLQTICKEVSSTFKVGTKVSLDGNDKVISGTLAKDTYLGVVGTKVKIWIQSGSAVVFDKDGKVDSGVLAKETLMRPTGATEITLKSATPVQFYSNGILKKATMSKDALLSIRGSGKALKFAANEFLDFDEKGNVISGAIVAPCNFRSPAGTILKFPAGARVMFDENGKIANEPPKSKESL